MSTRRKEVESGKMRENFTGGWTALEDTQLERWLAGVGNQLYSFKGGNGNQTRHDLTCRKLMKQNILF